MDTLNPLNRSESVEFYQPQSSLSFLIRHRRRLVWLATSIIGLAVVTLVFFSSSLQSCNGAGRKELNLPVAVMTGSCQLPLKPNQANNAALTSGLFKLAGLSNVEFYAFATSEPKEKVSQFYQEELRRQGFRVDPSQPGNATGLKINLSGVSTLLVVFYNEQQVAQLVDGEIKGKNVYVILWDEGNFANLS